MDAIHSIRPLRQRWCRLHLGILAAAWRAGYRITHNTRSNESCRTCPGANDGIFGDIVRGSWDGIALCVLEIAHRRDVDVDRFDLRFSITSCEFGD